MTKDTIASGFANNTTLYCHQIESLTESTLETQIEIHGSVGLSLDNARVNNYVGH